jgi:hypothetical protein
VAAWQKQEVRTSSSSSSSSSSPSQGAADP